MLVDVVYFEIDRLELATVKSVDVGDSFPNADTAKGMGRNPWPIGHRRGMRDQTVTIEAHIVAPPEFDWYASLEAGTNHLIVYEEASRGSSASGNRFILKDFQIYGIEKTVNGEGELAYSITGKPIRHIPEGAVE